jgi:BMFP domain-containing protein YqiC
MLFVLIFAAPPCLCGYPIFLASASKEIPMENRILDDLAKVAAGALGGVSGLKQEMEARMRQQFERVLAGMAVVNREEFEAVKAMAALARVEQEKLAARLAALEARLETGVSEPTSKPADKAEG